MADVIRLSNKIELPGYLEVAPDNYQPTRIVLMDPELCHRVLEGRQNQIQQLQAEYWALCQAAIGFANGSVTPEGEPGA